MASLGQELRRERELRGISLKEISHQTKININLLNALEEDKLELLPGRFFIKGIIRAYARSIGFDEDHAVNKYLEMQFQEEASDSQEGQKAASPLTSSKIAKMLLVSGGIAVLLAVIAIGAWLITSSSPKPAPAVKKSPPPVVDTQTVSPPLKIEPAEEKVTELNFEASFWSDTWIQVFVDGEMALDTIKKPGEKLQVRALEELIIHLGNAGGFTFTLNGKPGKPFGDPGAVVKNIRITLENYPEFLQSDEDKAGQSQPADRQFF
jgi:cytoskeletal protein RodZ